MRAQVEKDVCIGCGSCPSLCPEIFKMDDDGLATTITEQVVPELENAVQDAADSCPTEAIVIG